MIKINNLSITFGDKNILNNISFNIKEKEFTTIVGKSGVGKSVLIKSILGLITPKSGEIIIDNKSYRNLSSKELLNLRKNFSMLFQNSALLDSLDIFHNIALPLKEHTTLNKKELSTLVKTHLKMVGLENTEDLMPADLSGGMKKRAALARAIILKPKYIIFDEPTTGLDPIIASEIMDLIINLQQQFNYTAIIITHDIRFLNKIGGHLIMLKDTKIYFDGTVNEFLNSDDEDIKFFIESY